METKTLKIEIPNGYEIDKEKSTFENIVFKKVDDIVIKWNSELGLHVYCYNSDTNKSCKIEIPNGYEIDKEKSTFENIVFKKVDEFVIKWNKSCNGVEIKADGEHFILDGNPNFHMNWYDAMRFYNKHKNHTWNLPTIKQLQVIDKYFDEINNVIEDNGGFLLSKDFYWSNLILDEYCAWGVTMCDGRNHRDNKNYYHCVRAVSAL